VVSGGNMTPTRFFLVAGEPSGDRLGAALIKGLRRLYPQVEFSGVGGPLMQAEGLESLFAMEELSIMGLAEVLPKLPALLQRVRQTAAAARSSGAEALITIDSPDFCLRVAKQVKATDPDFPVVHYVAPSVWAWRPKRAVTMARVVDHVLTLLPFEPPLMEAAGMTAEFVGHPVVAMEPPSAASLDTLRRDLGIAPEIPVLTLLPGSRSGEVTRIAPVFRDVVIGLRRQRPDLRVILPSVGARVGQITEIFRGLEVDILDPRGQRDAEQRKLAAFRISDAALAASGTVSLELARTDTPMVIAYRQNPLTAFVMKRIALIDTVTLVNIVSETRSVPEFLLRDCKPEKIQPVISAMLEGGASAVAQRQAMATTMRRLGEGGEDPGLRAARSVQRFLELRQKTNVT